MTPAQYRLVLDRTACVGHGRCYALAPALFEDDDQGFGVVRHPLIDGGRLAEAQRAVAACPERAITVTPIKEN